MIRKDYDKEFDILFINFGGKVEHSRELRNVNLVLDFNKKDEVVGFELEGFLEALRKNQIRLDKLLKKQKQT